MNDVSLIVDLILKILTVVKPSELEKIKNEIRQLELSREKTKQDALQALEAGDMAALNRIIAQLLDM